MLRWCDNCSGQLDWTKVVMGRMVYTVGVSVFLALSSLQFILLLLWAVVLRPISGGCEPNNHPICNCRGHESMGVQEGHQGTGRSPMHQLLLLSIPGGSMCTLFQTMCSKGVAMRDTGGVCGLWISTPCISCQGARRHGGPEGPPGYREKSHALIVTT